MGMREVKDDERVDGRPWRPLRGQWVRSSNYSTPTDTGLLVGRVKTAVAWSSMRTGHFLKFSQTSQRAVLPHWSTDPSIR